MRRPLGKGPASGAGRGLIAMLRLALTRELISPVRAGRVRERPSHRANFRRHTGPRSPRRQVADTSRRRSVPPLLWDRPATVDRRDGRPAWAQRHGVSVSAWVVQDPRLWPTKWRRAT